jgi:hypothetical protein
MNNPKPFEMIASRFQVSNETAKYFLTRVQKSFKVEKPPHALIVGFMEELEFESLPKPYLVATMMNEGGVWVHAMNAEPREPVDEEDTGNI